MLGKCKLGKAIFGKNMLVPVPVASLPTGSGVTYRVQLPTPVTSR